MKLRFNLIPVILLLSAFFTTAQDDGTHYYRGVDLSYVNEMDDCGAIYRLNGEPVDAYQLFADYGANLVRIRLWHTPDWTEYSIFDDVVRSFQRAKDADMDTLLDFHYSDMWADPSRQNVPAAWADLDDKALGDDVYDYTVDVLTRLGEMDLLPDLVQVGNEINSEILRQPDSPGYPINWERNAYLINQSIHAVRDVAASASSSPEVIIHIAQPENVEGWLLAATDAGVVDFDIIGISYYTGWSDHSLRTLGNFINQLRHRFGKEVMIVETAYPWTLGSVSESATNIVDDTFLLDDYPASPEGQLDFMVDLTQTVYDAGGLGVIYWEPAWVSTDCSTLWGQGSHWENASFFDFRNEDEVLEGIEFLQTDYTYPVDFSLSMILEGEQPETVFLRADFAGMGRRLLSIQPAADGRFVLNTRLPAGTEIHYQFFDALPANDDTALIYGDCLDEEGMFVLTVPITASDIQHTAGTCDVAVHPS